jgi:hypothetical protein
MPPRCLLMNLDLSLKIHAKKISILEMVLLSLLLTLAGSLIKPELVISPQSEVTIKPKTWFSFWMLPALRLLLLLFFHTYSLIVPSSLGSSLSSLWSNAVDRWRDWPLKRDPYCLYDWRIKRKMVSPWGLLWRKLRKVSESNWTSSHTSGCCSCTWPQYHRSPRVTLMSHLPVYRENPPIQ